jgi:hypothetical protein
MIGIFAFLYFMTTKILQVTVYIEYPAMRKGVTDWEAKSLDSTRVYAGENRAVAMGVGRITENTMTGRQKAREAALADARSNLLVLRRKFRRDIRPAAVNAAEEDVPVIVEEVQDEHVQGDLYFVEIEVEFDQFLNAEFDERRFISL